MTFKLLLRVHRWSWRCWTRPDNDSLFWCCISLAVIATVWVETVGRIVVVAGLVRFFIVCWMDCKWTIDTDDPWQRSRWHWWWNTAVSGQFWSWHFGLIAGLHVAVGISRIKVFDGVFGCDVNIRRIVDFWCDRIVFFVFVHLFQPPVTSRMNFSIVYFFKSRSFFIMNERTKKSFSLFQLSNR